MTILSGTWTLTAIGNDAGWRQAMLIHGSDASDGIHEMTLGSVVGPVIGTSVDVRPVAFNPAHGAWEASVERSIMTWDATFGITVVVSADDNPAAADGDFNDLVVRCTSADPLLQPPRFSQPVLDLTIPQIAIGQIDRDAPWYGTAPGNGTTPWSDNTPEKSPTGQCD